MKRKKSTKPSAGASHEGRELELMLAGKKPLALFFDTIPECGVIPDETFAPHVENGTMVKAERIIEPLHGKDRFPATRVALFAMPSEAWRIDEALKVLEPVFTLKHPPTDDDDIVLGRLLGYAEDEISRFVGPTHKS